MIRFLPGSILLCVLALAAGCGATAVAPPIIAPDATADVRLDTAWSDAKPVEVDAAADRTDAADLSIADTRYAEESFRRELLPELSIDGGAPEVVEPDRTYDLLHDLGLDGPPELPTELQPDSLPDLVPEIGLDENDGSDVCMPDCAGKECGDDGCGGNCGDCGDGDECNGPVECVEGLCVVGAPTDCSDGLTCTEDWCDLVQGCQHTLSCGNGEVCDADGNCCVPIPCGTIGKECGSQPDGCGGTAACGECPVGETCKEGVCSDGNCKAELISRFGGRIYSLAAEDGYAFVAWGQNGLRVVDISSGNPEIVGQVEVPGRAVHVVVKDGVAFVSALEGGLWTIDVADPLKPALLSSIPVQGLAVAAAVENDLAYVAGQDSYGYSYQLGGALTVVDVSDPGNMIPLGAVPVNWAPEQVALKDGHVLVASSPPSRLFVVDVSDPQQPNLVIDEKLQSGCSPLAVWQDAALVACSDEWGLRVLDMSDPSHPVVTDWKHEQCAGAYWVSISDGLAFVSVESGALLVLDLSIPLQPVLVGKLDGVTMTKFVSWKGKLVGNSPQGLIAMDVSVPAAPSQTGLLPLLLRADHLAVHGKHVYASVSKTMHVLDVASPAAPAMLGEIETGSYIIKVVASSGPVFVLGHNGELTVLDASDPLSPKVLGKTSNGGCGGVDLWVAGGFAYMLDGISLIHVFDVSNPAAPSKGTWLQMSEFGGLSSLSGDGSMLFVLGSGQLYALDLADPASPKVVGTLEELGWWLDIEIAGGFAFVPDFYNGLLVMAVNDPQHMAVLSALSPEDLGLGAEDFLVAVDIAFDHAFLEGRETFTLVDVAVPQKPVSLGTVGGPPCSYCGEAELDVEAGYAFVAGQITGLWTYDVRGCW